MFHVSSDQPLAQVERRLAERGSHEGKVPPPYSSPPPPSPAGGGCIMHGKEQRGLQLLRVRRDHHEQGGGEDQGGQHGCRGKDGDGGRALQVRKQTGTKNKNIFVQ